MEWVSACPEELGLKAEWLWVVMVEQAPLGDEFLQVEGVQMRLPVRRGSETSLHRLLGEPVRGATCTHG